MDKRYYLEKEDNRYFCGFSWDYILLEVDESSKEIIRQLRFDSLKKFTDYIDFDLHILSDSNVSQSDIYNILQKTSVDIILTNTTPLYSKRGWAYFKVPDHVKNNTYYILTHRLGYTAKMEKLELETFNFKELKREED